MAYTPTTWIDRAVQYAKRYILQNKTGSEKNLYPPFANYWVLHENTRMKQTNFVSKVSGSTTANANISKNTAAAALTSPGGSWFAEETDPQYTNMSTLNATSTTHANGTNTYIIQNLYSFDLIEHVFRNYASTFGGAGTTAAKVAWLKANVAKIIVNWHGHGSSPSGNKAYIGLWNTSSSLYDGTQNHTSGSVTKLTQTSTSMGVRIDTNGFFHVIAYADASNGSTNSTINTDYVEIEVYMAAGSIPITDYDLSLNATAGTLYSTIELAASASTSYTVSMTKSGLCAVQALDASLAVISTVVASGDTLPKTFTTPSGTVYLKTLLYSAASGVYTFSNPQLELGSSATSFSPMLRYEITQSPGIVTTAGTPLNAANLNLLETGLQTAAATADTHIANQSASVHGSTSSNTASKLVHRDANARAQFADPSAAQDAATKAYVDARYVTGSYTGDAASSRDISLPFTPTAVFVQIRDGSTSHSNAVIAFALSGSPTSSSVANNLVLGTSKFTVVNPGGLNTTALVYHYIAYK